MSNVYHTVVFFWGGGFFWFCFCLVTLEEIMQELSSTITWTGSKFWKSLILYCEIMCDNATV